MRDWMRGGILGSMGKAIVVGAGMAGLALCAEAGRGWGGT